MGACGHDHGPAAPAPAASPVVVAEADTKRAERALDRIRGLYLRRWMGAVERFYGAQITGDPLEGALAALIGEVHAAIDEAWPAAWRTGQQVWGGAAQRLPSFTDGFAANIRRQKQFATRFAIDIADGVPERPGRVSVPSRIAMYAQSLEGAYQRGAVEGAPPGQLIWWRLGACLHCVLDPHARVLTRRGEVPIADVVPGDEVFTHRARWRRVLKVHVAHASETEVSREAYAIEASGGRRLRVTGDHKVLTPHGWHEAKCVAVAGGEVLQSSHVSTLRDLLGAVEIDVPHDGVPEVPSHLRLRPAEVASFGALHDVRLRGEVGPARCPLDGPEVPEPGGSESQSQGRERPEALLGPAGGALHAEPPAGRPRVRPLSGRGGAEAVCLPQPLALGAGLRPDSGRDGDPSPQRGSDGRPPREPRDAARPEAQAAPPHWAERVGFIEGGDLRHLRSGLLGHSSPGDEDGEALLRARLSGPLVVAAPCAAEGGEDLRRVRSVVRGDPGEGQGPGDVFEALRRIADERPGGGAIVFDGRVPDDAALYDLTVEEDHSYIVEGFVVANCTDCPILAANSPYTAETLPTLPRAGATQCRSRCRCSLEFRPARGVTAPEPAGDRPRGDMVERLTAPPPEPPAGRRIATDDERRLLADLELRMAHANRRADAAHAAGNFEERDRWLKIRRDANAEIIRLTREARIQHVPTFSTSEVLRGVDIRAGNVDSLVHLRGLDGTTIHRAQAAAINEALDEAQKDLAGLLAKTPPTTPAVPTLTVQVGDDGKAVIGKPRGGQGESAAWPVSEAVVADLPATSDAVVASIVGAGTRATLEVHQLALRVLAAAPYRVEVGPFDDGWEDTVAAIGTWVRGPADEVDRFVRELDRRSPTPGIAVAPWQEAA